MSRIIDVLFGFIAYACVATVITLALVIGYLWHNDRLSNEKLFRLMALVQDVDLQQMTAAEKKSTEEVPPEEPSLNQGMHHQQVQDRNFEVKLLALQRGRQEYDTSLQQLNEKIDRYDRIAQDWQSRLKQEQELTSQQNVAKVVSQLEQVTPDVGKEQLKMWIAEKKMDDAILLMSRMSESKLSKILKTFETPEELAKLHEIHERIISSGADNSKLENALDELNKVDGKK